MKSIKWKLGEPSFNQRKEPGFILFLALPVVVLWFYHIVDKGHGTFLGVDGVQLRQYPCIILHAIVEQVLHKGKFIVQPYLKVFP